MTGSFSGGHYAARLGDRHSWARSPRFHPDSYPLSSRFYPAFAPVFLRSIASQNHKPSIAQSLWLPRKLFSHSLAAQTPWRTFDETKPTKATDQTQKPLCYFKNANLRWDGHSCPSSSF
jgi:hypothetical protein